MGTVNFSWSDSLQATFSYCLYCFGSSTTDNDTLHSSSRPRNALVDTAPPPRARPDELEGLLADSDSADAETMSLHSNMGDERRRKKHRRPRRGIRLFGYDLFGRSPIQLPDSDDEDYHGRSGHRSRTISSSTLDSDAAPIDAAALDEASIARLAAATAAAEEEQRRAKEERRRLKRERKELKKMALAMAMGMHMHSNAGQDGFEGFPGSGDAQPYESFSGPGSGSGSGSISFTGSPFTEDFGPFKQGHLAMALPDDDGEVDGADFGAESYARPKPTGTSSGGALSDSRSRTSGSVSTSNGDPSRYNHHYLSQSLVSPIIPEEQSKKRSTRAKSLSSKHSDSPSLSTSQSPSLPSPAADRTLFSHADIVSPEAMPEVNDFEGFQGGTLDLARGHADAQQEGKPPSGSFPSVGLRGVQRTKSDMGVFLARRGDE